MWVGVTLTIPEPHQSVLARARAGAGDPLAPEVPPHVTLVPPTMVADRDLGLAQELLARCAQAHPPFTMSLAGTGTFRPVSPVVYVAVHRGWRECVSLQHQLNGGALAREREFPYHPHVTIAHNLPSAQLDLAQESMRAFSAEFTISTIELHEHGADGVWREVSSYQLFL